MARKKSKKSSKLPEPFNSMLDLVGGIAMGMVADHMENKYHYGKKGKINPYAVSAFGITSGKLKTTEDLIRTGAVLGALGSFDVDVDDQTDASSGMHGSISEDSVFKDTHEIRSNDNRYAWRLNTKEGIACGVSPYDYETKEQYDAAIMRAKNGMFNNGQTIASPRLDEDNEKSAMPQTSFYVKVSRLDNGSNQYYWTTERSVKVGDIVLVETEADLTNGVVIAIEKSLSLDYRVQHVVAILKQ